LSLARLITSPFKRVEFFLYYLNNFIINGNIITSLKFRGLLVGWLVVRARKLQRSYQIFLRSAKVGVKL
jgi:hypothetical protein